jgi:hypothetical protein
MLSLVSPVAPFSDSIPILIVYLQTRVQTASMAANRSLFSPEPEDGMQRPTMFVQFSVKA